MERLLLTENVRLFFIVIYAIMSFFTIVTYMLKLFCRKESMQSFAGNFLQRLKSFWMVIVLFTVALVGTKVTAFALITLISFLALKEFLSLAPKRDTDRITIFFARCCLFIVTGWSCFTFLSLFICFC